MQKRGNGAASVLFLDPVGSFAVALVLAITPLPAMYVVGEGTGVRLIAGLSLMLVAVALAIAGGWSWLLRDGLGPDAVDSHGMVAIQRFSEGFWLPLSICVATASVIAGLARRRAALLDSERGS